MNLQGLRVLVTRPANQADALIAQLQANGTSVIHLPLLEIQSLHEKNDATHIQSARQTIQQLDQFNTIIFISTNAVKFGLPLLENNWPQWPIGLAWYGIGVATQDALNRELKKTGISVAAVDPASAMTSEALLALPIFAELNQQRILIVQGEGGRGALAEVLQQRGGRVDTLICYRRAKPVQLSEQWLTINITAIDAIMVSSGEALNNLIQLPDVAMCKNTLMIVPSERVAQLAQQAGFMRSIAATNASDAAMIEALKAVRGVTGL